jgi:hypothetical protein
MNGELGRMEATAAQTDFGNSEESQLLGDWAEVGTSSSRTAIHFFKFNVPTD